MRFDNFVSPKGGHIRQVPLNFRYIKIDSDYKQTFNVMAMFRFKIRIAKGKFDSEILL